MKRNVFVNECVRRLRNCSLGLPWEKKAVFLTDYMARLKSAGYSQTFRIDIFKQAVTRYGGMLGSNREGKQPMYRSKEWIKANRNQVGLGCGKSGKSNWIAKGGVQHSDVCASHPPE